MSNNSNNNNGNNNSYRSLTNSGWRSVPTLPRLDDNTLTNTGNRCGNMLPNLDTSDIYKSVSVLTNNQSNGFLSDPYSTSLSSLEQQLNRKTFHQLNEKSESVDQIKNKDYNVNKPFLIISAPIYSNVIDQDSIDTCCHLSKVVVEGIQQTLLVVLEAILQNNELEIDYQVTNKFEFSGRVFKSSLSDFIIKVFKLKQKDKKGNVSVVEIRKVHGDDFGYYDFEALLLEKLQTKGVLLKQSNNKSMFGKPLNMDFGSLTLDDSDDEMLDISEFSDNDIISSMQENDEEFDYNLTETLLETLYCKDSFREEYMHDAHQLSTYLRKDDDRSKNMINYILKNETKTIISKILDPIKSNKLFCAFIIVHVLESIVILLSNKDIKSKLNIPKSLKNDIKNIKTIWSNKEGVKHNLGNINITFTRSQQIERRCESLLQLID